jgi:flagellar biosynthesis component FlhA
MKIQRFNWQIWAGFLLSLAASLSYPFVFVRWPLTRDFPWATLLLYGVAAVLLVVGVRRAFASGRALKSKIAASILATLSVVIIGLFLFSILIMARWLPAAHGAPQVGQKAPDFALADANGKTVSLSELLSSPINLQQPSSKPRGVLLIFYRGYW